MNTTTTPATPVTTTATSMSACRALLTDIKLAHTVFAMPFALLGMMLAAGWMDRLPTWMEWTFIIVCMISARTFAMVFNRIADAKIDALNPRTQKRALASGRVSQLQAGGALLLSGCLFIVGASGFLAVNGNVWPVALSPAVLALLAFYSLAKRFTWLCHLILGLALAVSPLAAGLAIEPAYLAESTVPWAIAAMVLCWVGGFDILYAMQDIDVDRELSLYSMPASLGEQPALWISRILHLASFLLLGFAGWVSPQLGVAFLGVCVVVGILLIIEHALVWRSRTHHLDMAFFTVNGVISIVIGAVGCLEVWL